MLRWVLGLIVLMASIAGLVLGVLNPDPATLDLGFVEISLSLGALIALAVATGLVLGLLLGALIYPRKKHRASASSKSADVHQNQSQGRALNG